MISRYIAYALRTDKAFCENLIGYALNKTIEIADKKVAVVCEKAMNNGRADMFVETEKYTLTVENKIFSWEHNDQTTTYHEYLKNSYLQKENGCLYLKPNWNQSSATCKEFREITYEQISKYLVSDDPKLLDLKKAY